MFCIFLLNRNFLAEVKLMANQAVELMDDFDDDSEFTAEVIEIKPLNDAEKQMEIKRRIEEVLEARKFRAEYGDLDDWD